MNKSIEPVRLRVVIKTTPQSTVLPCTSENVYCSCAKSSPTFLPQLLHKTNSWPSEEAEKMLNWFPDTGIHMLIVYQHTRRVLSNV